MKNYTVTLHIGRRNKTGFGTRIKMNADIKGSQSYETAVSMMSLLDEKVFEKTGLQLLMEINGVFIPNDFDGKGYTIEEAYHHAMETNVDLFLDMLNNAITGVRDND